MMAVGFTIGVHREPIYQSVVGLAQAVGVTKPADTSSALDWPIKKVILKQRWSSRARSPLKAMLARNLRSGSCTTAAVVRRKTITKRSNGFAGRPTKAMLALNSISA